MTNADKALELVADGMTLGLGSGHAAERFVAALGERVKAGLKVRGVATSKATAALAARHDIPVVDLEAGLPIDITFDGADEVDPHLNLIKGYGNALVREKVVAAASRKLVILIGPERVAEKRVDVLGRRGKLPVEVIPFAEPLVRRRLAERGLAADLLLDGPAPHVTDNGNHLLHVRVGPIADPAGLDRDLKDIPGVVGTGLFLGMAAEVIVEDGGQVEVLRKPS